MNTLSKKLSLLFFVFPFFGCGESSVGTSTGNPTYFPSGLAVASPFDTTTKGEGDSLKAMALTLEPHFQGDPFLSRYADATTRIDRLLNGTESSTCNFNARRFLTPDTNATCYGPEVAYEAHPNANGPDDPRYNGILPGSDVGLWTENDESGHACVAAQLNSRLDSVHDRVVTALEGLATLICVSNVNDIVLPTNASEDLTDEMNALGLTNAIFSSALLSHSNATGTDRWSYDLDLTVTRDSENFDIVISLTHIPGASDGVYQGLLSYRVDETFLEPGNCPSGEQTYNGSLLYNRTSATNLNLEARDGTFCEHNANGLTDGIVDPTRKHNNGEEPNGWANNFSTFTATFHPSTLVGNYAYSWQAGNLDQFTRVFNAVVDEDESGNPEGEAFYGFGDDIAVTDGALMGMICNWAGPNGNVGNGRDLTNLAQHQVVRFNTTTGKFEVENSQTDYAPTNSCNYDGTGDFRFDSDGDGTIDTDPSIPITNDLAELLDEDGDGLFDVIEGSGFSLPVSPLKLGE